MRRPDRRPKNVSKQTLFGIAHHFVNAQAQRIQTDKAMRVAMIVIDGAFLEGHKIRIIK